MVIFKDLLFSQIQVKEKVKVTDEEGSEEFYLSNQPLSTSVTYPC